MLKETVGKYLSRNKKITRAYDIFTTIRKKNIVSFESTPETMMLALHIHTRRNLFQE